MKAFQTQCRVLLLTLNTPPMSRYGLIWVEMGGGGRGTAIRNHYRAVKHLASCKPYILYIPLGPVVKMT